MFKRLLSFLKSRTFFKHLLIYLVAVFLLFWIVGAWLRSTTNHGETIKVPDFSGLAISELNNFIKDKQLQYLVIDSIYDTKAKKGCVVKQEPEAGAEVKENRTVYLYVTSVMPPRIEMPKLIDRSLRQASAMITTFGLKMAAPKFVPDQCANCVLDQQLMNGKRIEPGTPVEKGTVIRLIVGKGLSEEEVGVPCLYGLTKKEAIAKLLENSLSVGSIIPDSPKDTLNGKVYRQSPSCGKESNINMGGTVDLYLTGDQSKIPAGGQAPTTDEDDEPE
ncbi:MAG: PASTA domain-containing protein [Bacteroidia bacterium]